MSNRKVTNDEYLALALRYNEQRTINDSLQREIAELKHTNKMLNNYFQDNMLEIDKLKDRLDEFIVDEEQKYSQGIVRISANLDNRGGE
jgi:FtsZ-binding cell division protein ZapB